jgi:uncharacterized protein involved in exopolysaccharide biosynthesis
MPTDASAAPAMAPLFPAESPDHAPFTRCDALRLVFKHGAVVLACTLVVGALTTALYSVQTPVHTTSARLLIQTDQLGAPSFLSGVTAWREAVNPEPITRKIETEMELMRSRSNALSVVEKFNLTSDLFPRAPAAVGIDALKGALNRLLGRAPQPASGSYDATAELLITNLNIEPLRSKVAETGSNLLELSLQSTDPALAPQVLAELLANYMRQGTLQNRRIGEESARLIGARLAEAQKDLRQAEDGILSLVVKQGNSKAASATQDLALDAAGPTDPAFGDTRGSSPATLTLLRTQAVELQARLEEMRQLYTEDNDNVKTVRRRLAELRQRLAAGVRTSARTDADLARLERSRLQAQERSTELQKKLDQIDLYLRLTPTEAESRVVVDPPSYAAAPKGKKPTLLLIAGPLAGLFLGLLIAGLRELLDTRLQTARDVTRQLGVPVLGELPQWRAGELPLAGTPSGGGAA